jgi:hypothetical protein
VQAARKILKEGERYSQGEHSSPLMGVKKKAKRHTRDHENRSSPVMVILHVVKPLFNAASGFGCEQRIFVAAEHLAARGARDVAHDDTLVINRLYSPPEIG